MRYFRDLLAFATLGMIAAPAAAAEVNFQIDYVFFSGAANYAFRVFPAAQYPLADCNGNFAYVNADHPNYQVYVAALMSAFSTSKRIRLIIENDANGYCRILEGGFAI